MTARVLRAGDRRRTPWKNGGGETAEISVHPRDAGFDDFDWRISTAVVAEDGPFSTFPDVDRTLTVLAGLGLDLAIDQEAPKRLTPESPPFSFPADAPCIGVVLGDPVTDLNVMTRRGRFTHTVHRISITMPLTLHANGNTILVFCQDGAIEVEAEVLKPGDALLFDGSVQVTVADGPSAALIVTLQPSTHVER